MDESLTQITTADANSGVDESQILQNLQQTFEPTKEKFILQGQPVNKPPQFTLTDMYTSLAAPQASQVTPISGEKHQEYENYSSDEDIEQTTSKPTSLTDFQMPAEYSTENWATLMDKEKCFGCGYEHDPNDPCPTAGEKC